jgi:hypothetical protein
LKEIYLLLEGDDSFESLLKTKEQRAEIDKKLL